ncbi:PspC domain-containing protein [Vagococcus hydrophili]|uniref:PspC domain-containing protein n=1 Tax=Vagococcus hydrophili TaxID=2714947 RepID=A0A6G8APY0_9ENTE|nr:PspC domain-containing protein [Vagococcus hydrophili]QIL47138.1 PspC domain-containing protein [Vagococcus hydrophili]
MKRKLTKSRSNVVISGSLAGVAEFIGIDATIVRVIYVLLALFTVGFPGFILYIALMVLLPSGSNKRSEPYNPSYRNNNNDRNPYYSDKPRKEAQKVDNDDWSDF